MSSRFVVFPDTTKPATSRLSPVPTGASADTLINRPPPKLRSTATFTDTPGASARFTLRRSA